MQAMLDGRVSRLEAETFEARTRAENSEHEIRDLRRAIDAATKQIERLETQVQHVRERPLRIAWRILMGINALMLIALYVGFLRKIG